MSSAVFRQLASGGEAHRPERLFRAAISAFVSLTRPTRREIAQLDDLALPLYPLIAPETRRYAAAVLSDFATPPPGLLRRLTDEPAEICAPLLVRSPALSDVDLIGLIARHGQPHARVIGRRAHLNPAIAALVRALSAQAHDDEQTAPSAGSASEADVRDRLRLIMSAANTQAPAARQRNEKPLPKVEAASAILRKAVFSSESGAFEAALTELLGISSDAAREITGFPTYGELIVVLKALGFEDAEAFLLTAAVFPKLFSQRSAIGFFLERYRALSADDARHRLQGWRDGTSAPGHADQPVAISK
ncbi:hypothetical protein JYP52_15470 [Nitratireductor aquibiodomus]|uniref:hypothetical protein n=1 Tax=Nitratireductor TaxID=245876 RepID=UPI0019D3BE61|nr:MULTISPECIES: hypothetical protein [Nitratireductor]MBN7762542.1 hypothetical protein [Nitratireductor aquibiodomus]MDJ1462113.1 hypothetical protein [Nitratireductor sp. GZWM139]